MHADQPTHLSLPDGTYLASEFNYSMPRTLKGCDTLGYKFQSRDKHGQSDQRLMKTFRPNRENDKGYYSDHLYESPMCEHAQMRNSDTAGYHKVNQGTIEPKAQSHRGNSSGMDGDLSAMTNSGRLTFPRTNTPNNTDAHLVAACTPWRDSYISNGLPIFFLYHCTFISLIIVLD